MSASFQKFTRFSPRALVEPRSTDENGRRREYTLNVILLGSILMLAVLEAAAFFSPSSAPGSEGYGGISLTELFILQVFFIFLYALSRRGFPVTASYFLVGGYFSGASYLAYEWGANWEVAVLGFALVIAIASILLGTRFGILTTIATGGLIILLWYVQWHGFIPTPREQQADAGDAIIFTALYCLLMLVAWLANRETERSLTRALRSESELKGQRDLLEIKVEERTRELRRNEFKRLEQVHHFAEFGRLSSGLFHDLLNLVNAVALQNSRTIPGNAKDTLAGTSGMDKRIESFTQAIRRQLAHEETRELFSLAESIEQVVGLLSYKANKARIRISFQRDAGDMLTWSGNPFKFHQAVMNLATNALEANSNIVTIAAGRRSDDFVVSVHDDGCGIAPAIREKIFEPFFTTKGALFGMGVGLATTKRIVEEDLRGTISVTSETGNGSTFVITFPQSGT
jgi:signal transduction histidine kinase